ncbi:MAG TPA: Holliday junction branch migration protein RuvA [Acidobacteriota bacterium]|nr:Holliday junction branch migration protein RuvA [Acidobacteriota bacterium]
MIGSLRGRLRRKATEGIIIDVGGVGYAVTVPLSTFYELPDTDQDVSLLIHTYVRDDAIDLFGFQTNAEQALFQSLISVSGIGPKLAVTILSGMESDTLVSSIADSDIARLTSIPGVGRKTAERMALELKDKVLEVMPAARQTTATGVRDDVLSALLNLGYRRRDAEAALTRLEDPADDFETLLRQTLRMLAK